jgi:hypothetical protein
MQPVVFRFAATGMAQRIIESVLDRIQERAGPHWGLISDPDIPGIDWSPPYQGFCTCGFERRFREWLMENPHSRSCSFPRDFCSCGQWAELDRWRDGQGHTPVCPKAKPNLVICDLGLFRDPDGKWFTDSDLTHSEWMDWRIRAIRVVGARSTIAA